MSKIAVTNYKGKEVLVNDDKVSIALAQTSMTALISAIVALGFGPQIDDINAAQVSQPGLFRMGLVNILLRAIKKEDVTADKVVAALGQAQQAECESAYVDLNHVADEA